MADGLTASDYWRIQSGFGAAPDTASRERFAAAGVAPLTTEEKFRQERGWGPASSAESQRAFQAADVMERGLPTAMLPEQYGGRPTGTTRRALRMQAEYDAVRQNFLENQAIVEDMEYQQARRNVMLDQEERAKRDDKIALEAAQLQAARDAKIQRDAEFIFDSIKGGVPRSDGTVTGPLNPYEEGSLQIITNLMDSDGMEDPRAREAVMTLYKDALRAEEKRMADQELKASSSSTRITELTKLAKLTERNASDLFTVDPETKEIIVNPIAVGEAEADLATREKAGKTVGPSDSVLNQESKELRGKIRDIDLDIIIENNLFNKAKTDKDREKAQSRIEQLNAQRERLATEYTGIQSVLEEGGRDTEPERPQKELSQRDQSALNWANANPDDPRSQRIKAKLGVQ